jgi:hypothetical protein
MSIRPSSWVEVLLNDVTPPSYLDLNLFISSFIDAVCQDVGYTETPRSVLLNLVEDSDEWGHTRSYNRQTATGIRNFYQVAQKELKCFVVQAVCT